MPSPDGLNDLIPVDPYMNVPAAQVDGLLEELTEDYEIGFGFYYRYMFRLP
jgi:hypothetical protein